MRLNLWEKADLCRVYVDGLPGATTKPYLYLSARGIRVGANDSEVTDAELWAQITELLVIPDRPPAEQFRLLCDKLRALPRPRRGASPIPKRPASASASASPPAGSRFGGSTPYGRDLAFDNIKNAQPVEIEVDHREPMEIDDYLRQCENVVVTRKHLDLGDYRINGHILVERKSALDFANSVQSSHLFDQAQRMSFDSSTLGVVILEGDLQNTPLSMLDSAITGAITCLSFVQGMNVLQTRHLQHTAYLLCKIAQHDRNGLGYQLTLRQKKPAKLLDVQRYVLEGLPGINTNLADRLLEEFGTVRAVFAAGRERLLQVKGLGPKRVAEIMAVIGAD